MATGTDQKAITDLHGKIQYQHRTIAMAGAVTIH
jgi:hypothetical protein